MDIPITNEQKVPVTLVPVTATGKPAALDGIPTWTKQSGDATVEPAADGLSAFLISGDLLADSTFLVEADADLGAGVDTISAQIVLHVIHANASNLGLTVGTPVPK